MADLIEKDGYPYVFGCSIDNENPEVLKDSFIEGIEVIISYPWPG